MCCFKGRNNGIHYQLEEMIRMATLYKSELKARREFQFKCNESKRTTLKKWLNKYGELSAAIVSGVFIALAWAIGSVSPSLAVILYAVAFIVGGYAKAAEGIQTLWKEKDLDVNLLMIFAAIGAASIGYWMEGALLIFIFSLSGALETYTMNRSSRDITTLIELKPETAIVMKHGKEVAVSIDALRIGDITVVKPGERIPADGVVVEGLSAVDQSSITGESIPVDKVQGDEVFAGTLNGQGALFVEVTKSSEATLFAKIIKLVQTAQNEKPASQSFMEKFERLYAKIIILITAAIILIPPMLQLLTWEAALYKAMVFMVVASPCALVASIMPAMLSAISTGARRGVLFKGAAYLEHLAGVKCIAFDKTGTLTAGKPVVTDVLVYGGYEVRDVLNMAAAMECLSKHPLAKAIIAKAEEKDIEVAIQQMSEFQAIPGWGLQARFNQVLWKIGKPKMLSESVCTAELLDDIARLEKQGKTVTVLHNEAGVAGVIALQDRVRDEAKRAVAMLNEAGVEVIMLTGDQPQTAYAIAEELGIKRDHVFAGLLPEHKAQRIKQMKERYRSVAMVGDGVNDAPALATATVGIAMGAAGSGAALETADIVLMNDGIDRIAESISLGKRTVRIIKQNIVFALTVIVFLISTNFINGISLPLGVVGHEGSTILVILNGLRLLLRSH